KHVEHLGNRDERLWGRGGQQLDRAAFRFEVSGRVECPPYAKVAELFERCVERWRQLRMRLERQRFLDARLHFQDLAQVPHEVGLLLRGERSNLMPCALTIFEDELLQGVDGVDARRNRYDERDCEDEAFTR